jgi:TonB family protein
VPACPSTPASIITRYEVPYPDEARAEHLEGTALARVMIDPDGNVVKVIIQKSTGSGILDKAAETVAQNSKYKPATDDCKNVASIYIMVIDFKQ